jgi:hypothetical protein
MDNVGALLLSEDEFPLIDALARDLEYEPDLRTTHVVTKHLDQLLESSAPVFVNDVLCNDSRVWLP